MAHGGQETAPLNASQLEALCMTLLTMGHENVATSMAWVLCLLAEHPEVRRRPLAILLLCPVPCVLCPVSCVVCPISCVLCPSYIRLVLILAFVHLVGR